MLFLLNHPEALDRIRWNLKKTGRSGVSTRWAWTERDDNGGILFQGFGPNIWHDEGEEEVAKIVFSEASSVPANFYIGLDERTTLAEADTLTTINTAGEPSGNGYARQAVASDATDFTVTQESGTWQAATKTVTFTASGGNWGTMKNAFMCDVLSGTVGNLWCSKALSTDRVMNDGSSLDVSLDIKIQEGTGV